MEKYRENLNYGICMLYILSSVGNFKLMYRYTLNETQNDGGKQNGHVHVAP